MNIDPHQDGLNNANNNNTNNPNNNNNNNKPRIMHNMNINNNDSSIHSNSNHCNHYQSKYNIPISYYTTNTDHSTSNHHEINGLNGMNTNSSTTTRSHSHSHPSSQPISNNNKHNKSQHSSSRKKQHNGSYHQTPSFLYHHQTKNQHIYKSHHNKTNKTHKQRSGGNHHHHHHHHHHQHQHHENHQIHASSRNNHKYHHQHQHQHNNNNNNNNNEALSDSEIVDLSNNNNNIEAIMIDKNINHHLMDIVANNDGDVVDKNTNITTVDDNDTISLSPLQIQEEEEEESESESGSSSLGREEEEEEEQEDEEDCDELLEEFEFEDDNNNNNNTTEFEHAFPVRVLAFDLDKTMVRTISLHTNEQPQPEQHPGGYFMFFDDDTKEYHHVYKRPFLKELLDFLYNAVVSQNKCKMMLCTHGTQKYAQTILERCKADKLFPLMLPRRDWCRRKFEDDYKPRRFKTIEKMAKSANEMVEDVIMIDDDPGVYSKGDRCNGSLVHIKPFDDPYEQRDDRELSKLIKLLSYILKYGKNYYNKIFANSIRYTGLVKTFMNPQQMAQHSLFRAELLKRLIYDFNINMNKQERLGTVYLFDRYCSKHCINWNLLDSNKINFAYYVILLFACLFIARQYLYTDTKRPKQFRRDPYSAEIWIIHVDIYEKIVKKYKTMNGITPYNHHNHHNHHNNNNNHHHHHHHHHHHKSSKHHHKSSKHKQIIQNDEIKTNHHIDDDQLIIYQQQEHHQILQQQQQQQQQQQSQSHHRRKRKHKNREKQIYYTELHNITKQIFEGIGYPKLLHGLYHRPEKGFDSSLFIKYEDYVESLFHHIEKTQIQNITNNPFIKYD